ncbi:MAG: hypothetical protein RDV41_08570, partial [Planctomycetota bacterium]|nr:hypothetical protein [Planctomycetota bacterium]
MFRLSCTAVLLLVLSVGCCCRKRSPVGGPTPEKAFETFREKLLADDTDGAYELFSTDTQERYSGYEFWGLLSKSKAGKLIRYQLLTWVVANVEMDPDGGSAWLTLRHPARTEYENRYELVAFEPPDGGQALWRIRFYLADMLGSPRGEEDY